MNFSTPSFSFGKSEATFESAFGSSGQKRDDMKKKTAASRRIREIRSGLRFSQHLLGRQTEVEVEHGIIEEPFTVPSPWRQVTWTPEAREELLEKVKSYKPGSQSVSEVRVLLLGPVGSGKSSFISSVQSVFSGRVLNRAMVGTSRSTSFTKKLQSFTFRPVDEGSGCTSLVLCDVMGLGEGDSVGLSLYDALCVIKGHVPEGHQFSAEEPVMSETPGFIKNPSLKDKIHCVAFVVDASGINTYPKGLSTMFQKLRDRISSLGVHQVVLLTHIDEVCKVTAQDISQVYRSCSIQSLMEKAGALLGMATSYIVPVRNYSSQLQTDTNTDILLLQAVDHILQYAELHFQDSAAEQKDKA